MRIAHVIDYFQPQLGYQETYLALEHQKLGHQVVVFTSDRYRSILYRSNPLLQIEGDRIKGAGVFKENGIFVRRFPVFAEIADRVWIQGLVTSLREFAPDAIHVHGVTTLTTLRVALAHLWFTELYHSILVVDDHMSEAVSLRNVRWFYPFFRTFFVPLINRSIDHFVAVSDDTKKFMIKQYGLSSEDIKVIRLGVDEEHFRPNFVVRKSIRQILDLPTESIVVIYTGKVIPRKQVDVLLKAIGMLAKDFPLLRLLIVGHAESDYLASLHRLAGQLEITDRIIWQEAVPHVKLSDYFAAADIAVWPAEHSISFLEAMACGLPLIVGDSPKSHEEVSYGNGFVFKVGDVLGLSENLRQLLISPTLRKAMGKAGRDVVLENYSWKNIAMQFLQLYHYPKQ